MAKLSLAYSKGQEGGADSSGALPNNIKMTFEELVEKSGLGESTLLERIAQVISHRRSGDILKVISDKTAE